MKDYEQRQKEWIEKHGLKVGDKVKPIASFELDASVLIMWVKQMDKWVGRKCKIIKFNSDSITLERHGRRTTWPYDYLEPVEKKAKCVCPTCPESTRYEVGKEYETWDDGTRPKHRPYAGYLDGRHWFKTGHESLATYAHIREIPTVDDRIGKWCVLSNTDAINAKSLFIYGVAILTESMTRDWRHCMLLSDFVKMVEDGE